MVHPLALVLDDAAHSRFPEPDGRVHVMPPLPGGLDALVGFTGTFALAGDLTQAEVDARVPLGEFSIPMSAAFVAWMGERLGSRAATHDAVFVTIAPGESVIAPVELVELVETDHPRVQRALRYRRAVRAYATTDGAGIVSLGRGITGRWEIGFEVEPAAQGAGLGRALASAAVGMLPAGTPVWAQVAPGNAASMRAVIGAGFRAVGAEILFVRAAG